MTFQPELNKTYLLTLDGWFVAPDGEQYKAVFGEVTGISSAVDTLGIETNENSTNWYLTIGKMIIAGCRIHYAIQTDTVSLAPSTNTIEHKGKQYVNKNPKTFIYCAT